MRLLWFIGAMIGFEGAGFFLALRIAFPMWAFALLALFCATQFERCAYRRGFARGTGEVEDER